MLIKKLRVEYYTRLKKIRAVLERHPFSDFEKRCSLCGFHTGCFSWCKMGILYMPLATYIYIPKNVKEI